MINKLNQLARKKYILFGIPLLCGVIMGTVITMGISHVKADTVTVSSQGSTSNQTVDTSGSTHAVIATQAPQPTANTPTTPQNVPTAPVQQINTNTTQEVSNPCH